MPDTHWLAGRLDASVTKMTMLCRDVLDMARLEAGKPLDLYRHPTDLVGLVRQLAAHYEHEPVAIHVRSEAPELVGMWDKFRLERVINNLLSNAIKYSPDGGEVIITIRRELATGPDAEGQGAGWAVFTVEDQGIGIPPRDLPHLFTPFFRAGNAVGKFKGTGLGLAGSRQIVEQHGGTISVESAEGQGSVFTVRLPIAAAGSVAPPATRNGSRIAS